MGEHDALETWRTSRGALLDSLALARQTISMNRTAAVGAVENIDRTLYPALVAEFQGFCRDLHNEAVSALIEEAAWPTEQLAALTTAAIRKGRGLDHKNPTPSVIDEDFRSLGLPIWRRVQQLHPEDYPDWRASLETLVRIRNAVAHSDQERIDIFFTKQQMTFAYWGNTRKRLTELAIAMNSVVRRYLVEITIVTSRGEDRDRQ
ncbi:Hypothetical protein CGLY_14925 [Corynebacterium glyciniphilum AJ 3170]|uniref:RiboL-PSP-HEPN domain-containing protein n=1 Tax=Corynebacterium glyciniphilum AJ 3170 TaxID=1404245 RepID=X5EFP7_9CORY|nr:hypothetical protein [Corynebacterium glyciniphilum]AHW65421.1 Hypothetical protein CGLY_14925 [Corynebacterium glyciniphilum AJ 3170]